MHVFCNGAPSMCVVGDQLTIHLNAKVDLVLGRVRVAVTAELDARAERNAKETKRCKADRSAHLQ